MVNNLHIEICTIKINSTDYIVIGSGSSDGDVYLY